MTVSKSVSTQVHSGQSWMPIVFSPSMFAIEFILATIVVLLVNLLSGFLAARAGKKLESSPTDNSGLPDRVNQERAKNSADLRGTFFARPVLVVVDMQMGFPAAYDRRTNEALKAEILRAMRAQWFVIVLEYAGFGTTNAELMSCLQDYPWHLVLEKNDDDGSATILAACRSQGIEPLIISVGGVNTEACVSATVSGLLRRSPDSTIFVLRQACNSSWKGGEWANFPSGPNVKIV